MDEDERSRRAEQRRREWMGGVAKSHAEMESVSTAFWLTMTAAERLGAVFGMWDEQMKLRDPGHEPATRLQRSVGGVRPRRG